MKIAICDDVLSHRETLRPFVVEFFRSKEIPTEISDYSSGDDILGCEENFDIVFLDIELGDMSGIEITEKLKEKNANCIIIVVTSYTDYLDAAMDLHVIRFLKKPVEQKRVYSALEKALQEMNEKLIMFSTKDNQIIRVKSRDIIYVEANLKAVTVCTDKKTYTVKESLKKIKTMLTASIFAVPHNSFIVNMNYISNFKREEITVETSKGEVKIQISNRKQPEFKRRFLEFIGEGE
ncbi:MAG: response regulator transcription factor [Clostridia bacterium]|nr:response regulator transcription factor [Clostridia bacterium]